MSFLVGLDLNDVQVQTDSGNTSTTAFTLDVASTTNAVAVYISGVRQLAGTDYNVSATTITFTTAPPTGTNNIMYVYTKAAIINTPADNTVGYDQLAHLGTATHVLTSNGTGSAPSYQVIPASPGGGGWLGETGSPLGTSADIIRINEQTLNNSVTIASGDNGSCTGPLTLASGVTLTVTSGSTFVVI